MGDTVEISKYANKGEEGLTQWDAIMISLMTKYMAHMTPNGMFEMADVLTTYAEYDGEEASTRKLDYWTQDVGTLLDNGNFRPFQDENKVG